MEQNTRKMIEDWWNSKNVVRLGAIMARNVAENAMQCQHIKPNADAAEEPLDLARLAIRCCQRSCILLLVLSRCRVCRTTRRSTWQMKLQPRGKKIPMICSSVHHDETVSLSSNRHLDSPWFAGAAEGSVDKEIMPCRRPFTWPTHVS